MSMSIRIWRWPVAGLCCPGRPVVVGVSLLVAGGMPVWFPKGAAGIDHIALPIIMLPGIWAVLFFTPCSTAACAWFVDGLASLSVAMLIWKFSVSA